MKFEGLAKNITCSEIGAVSKEDKFKIIGLKGKKVANVSIENLRTVWKHKLG
jgi:hypothetical protein